MGLLNGLRNRTEQVFLYFIYILHRVKVYLGLIPVKHSMPCAFEVEGILLSSFMHSERRIAACRRYDAFRPDDVMLCTYPKSGRHFTAEIIADIFVEGQKSKAGRSVMSKFEVKPPRATLHYATSGGKGEMSDLDAAGSPRIIVTHLPWDFMPLKVREGKVKVIRCMRNPKDVLSSLYSFSKKLGIVWDEVSWSDYVTMFMNGHVIYGSYFKYLQQWYPHRNMDSILNLQFEEMKQDLDANVRKVASFLNVKLTDQQVARIVVANTFDNKKRQMGSGHVIYRKGKSGGWKSDLTVEQNEAMDVWIQQEMIRMKDLHIKYE